MTALVVLMGVVMVLLVILVAGLLRSHADILRRLHALDGGEPGAGGRSEGLQVSPRRGVAAPPSVSGTTPYGSTASVALRGSRGLALLAFLSSGCSTCRPFWESLSPEVRLRDAEVRPVIVTKDPAEESLSAIASLAPGGVTTIMSSQAWDDFRVPGSPYFVLVSTADGSVVGEGAASTWDHVRALLTQAADDAGLDRGLGGSTDDRHRRVDDHLRHAGIDPGHPSLYQNPHDHPDQEHSP